MRLRHFAPLIGILLAACSVPTSAATPTSAPTLEPTVAPTPEPTITWATYHNDTYGFSFEYPADYNNPPYECGPQEDGSGGIILGRRIFINIQDQTDATLEQVADEFITQVNSVEQRVDMTIGGEPALAVDYRFGGTGRFGTVTFAHHAERLWVMNWTAGVFCDLPEGKIFEGDAYAHMLKTFAFTP
jgi:hypothetical protein